MINQISSINQNRLSSPSFGMALKVNQDIIQGIKTDITTPRYLKRISRRFNKLHKFSEDRKCDVVAYIAETAAKKAKKAKPKIVVMEVVSQADSEIKGTPMQIKLRKLGNFFSGRGFFKSIKQEIKEISSKQNTISKMNEYV